MTDKEKFKKLLNELKIDYSEEGKYIIINKFYVNYSKDDIELCISFNDYDFGKDVFQGFYLF